MGDLELPAGWRITQEFRHDGPPITVDTHYVVRVWTDWYERRWYELWLKKHKVHGWKRVYSARFREDAEQWVYDTRKAMGAK